MKRTAFSPHEEIYINHLKTSQKKNMSVQHYHDAYEIYLQLDGKRYLFYDNICYTLERGDMFILKPFEIHYAQSRDADFYERYVLNFQAEALRPILNEGELKLLLNEKIHSCIVHLSPEDTEDILGYFKHAEEYSKKRGFLSEKLLCSSVLQIIMKTAEHTRNSVETEGEHVPEQMVTVLNYINKHYKEDISLDDISDKAHMSKYYFCRKFHEVTGATVLEYLNNIRLTKVHSMLISTDRTIDEISSCTGFVSPINLTRAFKKVYGVSPREFRKQRNG